jgi:hypothetical protein
MKNVENSLTIKKITMKKIGIVFMSLMLVAMVGITQPRQRNINPEDLAKRQTEQIKEAVNLDENQEKKVYEINLETNKKMRSMREQMQGGGFDGMRDKMTELRSEQNKKMKAILTDAQWEKYEKYMEERRERMNNRSGGSR